MNEAAEKDIDLPDDINELKKLAHAQRNEIDEWKRANEEKSGELHRLHEQYQETRREYEKTAEKYTKTENEYRKTLQELSELKEKYRVLRHTLFGRSSEKWSPDERAQASLFNEAETYSEVPEEKQTERIAYDRVKQRGKRKKIPEEIPREEGVHDISEEEKTCACGKRLTRIGEETSEKLEIIPAQIKVIRHIRPKYACKGCEGAEDESSSAVKIAPAPEQLMAKSIASAGLISYIVTSKYEDALPLARQEKIFNRIGVDIPRQSMARWIMKLGERLSPLLKTMDERILDGQIVQMDETRIQVHNEPGKSDSSQSWMWVARGGPPERPITRYMYHHTREGAVAERYLSDFTGYLQSDAYGPYNKIGECEGVVHIGCLAHARRKFDEADKAASKGSAASKEILSMINKIYRVERELRAVEGLSEDEFLRQRREKAEPLFTKLEMHLEEEVEQVPPSTALGKAIAYSSSVLPKVRRYLDLYHLTPDNNASERAIRSFVVGRRNWMFSNTPRGAHASAAFYSLIESAKGASLKPYWYIRYVLQKLPEVEKTGNWQSLLPENFSADDLKTPSYL